MQNENNLFITTEMTVWIDFFSPIRKFRFNSFSVCQSVKTEGRLWWVILALYNSIQVICPNYQYSGPNLFLLLLLWYVESYRFYCSIPFAFNNYKT